MMSVPDGLSILTHLDEEDCVVCSSHSVQQTINLMKERGIKLDSEEMQKEAWTTPELIYASLKVGQLGLTTTGDHAEAMSKLQELREAHQRHVSELAPSEPTRANEHPGRPERRRGPDGRCDRAHNEHPYERQGKKQ